MSTFRSCTDIIELHTMFSLGCALRLEMETFLKKASFGSMLAVNFGSEFVLCYKK